jgi:hypothetical protein
MMSYNDTPLPDAPTEEISGQKPVTNRPPKWIYRAIQILSILLIVLVIANLINSHMFSFILGKGSIRGYVLDQNNRPVSGRVYVESIDLETSINEDGYFEIRGIPLGHQTVLIAWMNAGYEAPVEIHRGGITDLGTIHVPTDPRPDHDIPRLEWR